MNIKTRYSLLMLLFLGSIYLGICLGAETFTLSRLFSLSELDRVILFRIRLPRVAAAFITGAGLAVSGSVLQALLRNPLAESYTLGISGGASLGICAGVIMGKLSLIPFFAFIGAVGSVLIIISSSKRRFSNTTVILLGVALNFLFSSLVLFILSIVKNDRFQPTLMWLIGDISYFPPGILLPAIMLVTVISVHLAFSGNVYDMISMGEEKAASMGVDTDMEKKAAFFLCCVITGLCVSLGGIIGFAGLIVPHVSRYIFGSTQRRIIPVSFISGGIFLLLADTAARTLIRPVEIPVGVITGFAGGIFFLSILLKNGRREF